MPDLSLFSLAGKTALVTGGNGGIGLGIAKGLARAGAAVAIAGRNKGKNEKALKELKKLKKDCRSFTVYLGQTEKLKSFYKRVSKAMGGIDILINNAGITFRGRADETPAETFEEVQKINVTAPFVLSGAFAKERMREKKPGSIIITASLMSESSRPTTSAYTASKGAVRQLIKALAIDWAEFNIRVNGIGPGYIQTELTRPLYEDEEFDGWVKKRTPVGRWGAPDDFEGAAVYLASDASSFVTGQILYVDGGWLSTF